MSNRALVFTDEKLQKDPAIAGSFVSTPSRSYFEPLLSHFQTLKEAYTPQVGGDQIV